MTVFVYSEDPVAAAKVSEKYAKDNQKFEILGGAMGETALDRAGVKAVSEMPSREELISRSSVASEPPPRTSPGPLAHLLRTSRASSRPSRSVRKPRDPLMSPRGVVCPALEHILRNCENG
jgi:hypothetical protein